MCIMITYHRDMIKTIVESDLRPQHENKMIKTVNAKEMLEVPQGSLKTLLPMKQMKIIWDPT